MANRLPVLLRKVAALFAASVSESAATAAIVTVAFTIGSWVLHFTVAGHPGILDWIARSSLTQVLRTSAASVFLTALALGLATQIKLSIDVTNDQRNPDSDQRRKLSYLSVLLRISRLMRNLNGEM